MSEFNFDNMKNIDIPESWVEGALNVPQDQKSNILFFKNSKIIAFAASIVLVCLISVALFFITKPDSAVPPVKQSETEYNTFAHETESIIENSKAVINETKEKINTENSTEEPTEVSSEFVDETVEPTEKKEKPTEKVEINPDSIPSKPDSIPSNPGSIKPKPTNKVPTEKPTEEIQDSPPYTPDSVESYIESFSSGKIIAKISKNNTSSVIYCNIYDLNGNIMGGKNLYTSSKMVEFLMDTESECSEYSTVEYDIDNLGVKLKEGTYYVVFINDVGIDICNAHIYIS